MKPSVATPLDMLKTHSFVKFTSISLVSFSFLLLLYHLPSYLPSAIFTTANGTSGSQPLPFFPKTLHRPPYPSCPPPSFYMVTERTGIVDETGAMTWDFEIGDVDPDALEEMRNILVDLGGKEEENGGAVSTKVKYEKCEVGKSEYIPCLDNVKEIKRLNLSQSLERFERHCPEQGKGLDCLIPMPKGYQKSIPWPKSIDEVWLSNVPHTRLVDDKGGQNLIAIKKDKIIFPRGGAWSGEDKYLNQISQMIPDIVIGHHIRTALDIGCGVANFGASLLQRNVTTLSIAPKDVHENQIQIALERGVPAMVAAFATRRLLFPSQAFELIHCSSCGIDWTSNDGIWLLEADRMLRAGGYFVWATEPVYKHKENIPEQWKEMQDLTSRICWRLVKKEGYVALWQKPMNNSCYLDRGSEVQPRLCDPDDDPDNVWYVNLRPCITRLPENGYGVNVSSWPTRVHNPPDRLQSIKMDFSISRKELFTAESKFWDDTIDGYVLAYHWKQMNWRNVMDMRAGFGGFAAAMHAHQLDSWVMNVVPANEYNTLPVIYDRGLIGVMHDWCEPFDTYPRTYDLLHAAGLFSAEKKRNKCNISSIMLEMDRMLRYGGTVYIRDTVSIMGELEELATAMGWVSALHDTSEGPHASWKILLCDKRMP